MEEKWFSFFLFFFLWEGSHSSAHWSSARVGSWVHGIADFNSSTRHSLESVRQASRGERVNSSAGRRRKLLPEPDSEPASDAVFAFSRNRNIARLLTVSLSDKRLLYFLEVKSRRSSTESGCTSCSYCCWFQILNDTFITVPSGMQSLWESTVALLLWNTREFQQNQEVREAEARPGGI